jgi:hypothetical protein
VTIFRHRLACRLQGVAEAVVVFALAYATAFGETLTIAHFPYYTFKVGGWPARQVTSSCQQPALLLPSAAAIIAAVAGAAGAGGGGAPYCLCHETALPSQHPPQPTLPLHTHVSPSPPLLQDRSRMYTVGSLFYAIYFFVSFPMFYRMDEQPRVSPAV